MQAHYSPSGKFEYSSLEKEDILACKKTIAPRFYTVSGYGDIPMEYMIQLQNKRWYRVYCRCYSNIGTVFIKTKIDKFIVVEDALGEFLAKGKE